MTSPPHRRRVRQDLRRPGRRRTEEVHGLVDNAAKNAPAGSETAVAVFKSAVAAGNNALESVQKAVKQATDVAEANFNAVANTAVNATKATAKAKR
jgi:hypothetical protein